MQPRIAKSNVDRPKKSNHKVEIPKQVDTQIDVLRPKNFKSTLGLFEYLKHKNIFKEVSNESSESHDDDYRWEESFDIKDHREVFEMPTPGYVMKAVFLGRENKRTGLPFDHKSFADSQFLRSIAPGVEDHACKPRLLLTATLSMSDAWFPHKDAESRKQPLRWDTLVSPSKFKYLILTTLMTAQVVGPLHDASA